MEGPFKVLERIGDNACKLELPGNMHVCASFNVGDLAPYMEDNFDDLRATLPKRRRLMHTKSQANPWLHPHCCNFRKYTVYYYNTYECRPQR